MTKRRQEQLVNKRAGAPAGASAGADLFNRAVGLYQAGRLGEAGKACADALSALPGQPDILHLAGLIALAEGAPDRAARHLAQSLKAKPGNLDALVALGNAEQARGESEAAIAAYGKVLAAAPDFAEVHANLGHVYKEAGRLDQAVASYRQAVRLKPDFLPPYNTLGNTLLALGAYGDAAEVFGALFRRKREILPPAAGDDSYRVSSRAKLTHDLAQCAYLERVGALPPALEGAAAAYRALLDEIDWGDEPNRFVRLSETQAARIAPYYNRALHVAPAPALEGGAVNPALDSGAITESYFNGPIEACFFDDFLTAEALAALRRYCLDSTIWFDYSHREGFMGAMMADGFAAPLLMQIADELRRAFPAIFKDHQLRQLWAYKYDSTLAGITPHADFAAVNVNFWITPDAANTDPESGGLIVSDAEAPADWDFEAYNRDVPRIREFIAGHETARLVVPHRQNRALMFHSDLFHETDQIRFKDDYESRRINVTMLFGTRANAHNGG